MDRRELLFQDEFWMDGQNRLHRIADMDIKHAQNTYRYLTEAGRAAAYLGLLISFYLRGPGPSGDAATDAYEGELARLEAAEENPIQWMREQPLLVALQERGWGNPKPEPEPQPRHRELLVVLKVKIGHDADANPVEWDIEEAVKALPYDIEITDVR